MTVMSAVTSAGVLRCTSPYDAGDSRAISD